MYTAELILLGVDWEPRASVRIACCVGSQYGKRFEEAVLSSNIHTIFGFGSKSGGCSGHLFSVYSRFHR